MRGEGSGSCTDSKSVENEFFISNQIKLTTLLPSFAAQVPLKGSYAAAI